MLEEAAVRAAGGQFYEVTCEHLLLKVVEPDDGDAALILHNFGEDRGYLEARVQRTIEAMRTGNAGRPVISETLFQWLEDAWVVASLTYGATSLRSGHLLLQFIERGARYSGASFPELDAIPIGALKKRFEELVAPSPETPAAGDDGQAPATQSAGGEEALGRFTQSLTDAARNGGIDPIFGRHREIRQLIDILARRRKNNPIIVGEPGVGKTALVEGLARAIVSGDVPEQLAKVELRSLDMGLLQAGASVKGEFEKRLKAVISEVQASPRQIILFIDEAHTLIGGSSGAGDTANLLKPALARGELRTIAATTWSEYKKYFEKDPALERRFQPVKVDEPTEDGAIVMLRGLRAAYEQAHGVTIRDDAVIAAVQLSNRYITGRQLPDKAVDLLDTAAARVKIEQAARPSALIAIEEHVAALERERDAIERERHDAAAVDEERLAVTIAEIAAEKEASASLEQRWKDELRALAAIVAARQAMRSEASDTGEASDTDETSATGGANDAKVAVSADAPPEAAAAADNAGQGDDQEMLRDALVSARQAHAALVGDGLPLVHAEVDADAVAQVVASWTGIPAGKMKSSTIQAALDLEDTLSARVRGQDDAIATVAETIRMAHAGVRDPNTPIGVLLFVGPSGVGKTETALALADQFYGGERFVTTINMSEFQEKHTVSRLVGSPPGYVGFGEGGVLTEAVRQRPYSVVLLDECEKCHIDVMNLFFQVFDKGTLSDGEGRAIDFNNTVIILTSNLASAELMRLYDEEEPPDRAQVISAIRPILSDHFKPALLARMTVVPYRPISAEIIRDIAGLKLAKLGRRLAESHRLAVRFTDELVEVLVRDCNDADSGARNVDHVLRGSLMPALARRLLERLVDDEELSKLEIGVSPTGDWRFDFEES